MFLIIYSFSLIFVCEMSANRDGDVNQRLLSLKDQDGYSTFAASKGQQAGELCIEVEYPKSDHDAVPPASPKSVEGGVLSVLYAKHFGILERHYGLIRKLLLLLCAACFVGTMSFLIIQVQHPPPLYMHFFFISPSKED